MDGQLFIDGNKRLGQAEDFVSVNPANGTMLWKGKAASADDVNDAIESAERAFKAWSLSSFGERLTFLARYREILKNEKSTFAELISQSTGKPLWESLTEVSAMIGKLSISVDAYQDRCKDLPGDMAGAECHTRFRPHGVAVVIGPYNMPGHLPNGHIVPALLAGNTIVFKPSEQTPEVGEALVELFQRAAFPQGVINLIQGARVAGEALVEQNNTAAIYFTGSYQTGRAIHKALAGKPEKILALEMGGNNPLVVWNTRDIDAAVYHIIQSAFITSGQRCACARRLIIPDDDYGEELILRLVEKCRSLKIGPYKQSPEPFMGPVISAEAARNLVSIQKRLIEQGAQVLLAMRELNAPSAFLAPGILDLTPVRHPQDEEYFGPLLCVFRVTDFDKAIEKANESSYGLSAGLLSDSPVHYQRFRQSVRAGIINWNRQITGASSAAPFGGVGASGNHRPGAYFAADYCAYPVASIESDHLSIPKVVPPGGPWQGQGP
jgi:succinylglutamic semialdehyde dehydrogenase